MTNAESTSSDVAARAEVQKEHSFVQTLEWDWSQDLVDCDLDVANFWDFELNQGLLSNPDGVQPMFDTSMLPDLPDQISDSSVKESMEALVD